MFRFLSILFLVCVASRAIAMEADEALSLGKRTERSVIEMQSSETEQTVKNAHITSLDLSNDQELKDLGFLINFPNLKELDLMSCGNLENYQGIGYLKDLEHLNIFGTGIDNFDFMEKLCNLRSLDIFCDSLEEIMPKMSNVKKLERLDIRVNEFDGIEGLASFPQLKILSLRNDGEGRSRYFFPELDFLISLRRLEVLDLAGLKGIERIKPLAELPFLKTLNLSRCLDVLDIKEIKNFKSLKKLSLYSWKIKKIAKLRKLFPHIKINEAD